MLYLNFSLRSDAGRIRGNNEDNFYWNGQYRQDITCMKKRFGWHGCAGSESTCGCLRRHGR